MAITQHGPGAVEVPEAALQPGVYMYSQRVNGETLRVRYRVRTE